MTHEHTHDRTRIARRAQAANPDIEPGQVSRSAELHGPAHPEPSGLIQRKARDGNGVAEGADAAVAAAGSSSGEALPAPLLRKFEASLGADLSGVRVHSGGASAAAADAVGAKAYALGNDIHFAAGHYDPSSPAGEHLLAHEVAHTVQQAGRMQYKLAVSAPGDHLEHEADRAADAMVAGQAASVGGAGPSISRAIAKPTEKAVDPDRKEAIEEVDDDSGALATKWDALGGPKLLATVRAEVAAWKGYRQKPTTGMTMPGNLVKAALPKFPDEEMTPALREYASRQLGAEGLTLLGEMAAINNHGNTIASIFNVKVPSVKHQYEVTFTSSKKLTKAVVHYKNNLPSPWEWTSPAILIGGLSFSVDVFDAKKSPVSLGFEVDGSMTPDSAPVAYWGWNDFGGKVTVVDFPSGGVTTPIGGAKAATGCGVTFLDGPGKGMSFSKMGLKVSGGGPGGASATIKLGGKGGVGFVGSDADAKVKTAAVETKPPLVAATKLFRARILHFENGSATLPATKDLAELVELIRAFVASEFTEPRHADALRKNGVDPDQAFEPEISIDGWASMRWVDAGTEAERLAKNQRLSAERAQEVGRALVGIWGPWNYTKLEVIGRGSGINPSASDTLDAACAQQKVAALGKARATKREALAAAKAKGDATTIASLQHELDEIEHELDNYKDMLAPAGSKTHVAAEDWMRHVDVTVRWAGKVADLGAPSAT